MKVPLAEETVTPQTPTAPMPNFPNAVPAAYGAEADEAKAGMGKEVMSVADKIAQHAEKQLYWNAEAEGYNAVGQYKSGLQDILHNDNTKTIKGPNGADVQIPDGLSDRRLDQAKDAVVEFDKRANNLRERILKNLSPVAKNAFGRTSIYYEEARRNSLIAHEAQQTELYHVHSMGSAIDQEVHDATATSTKEDLMHSINNIETINNKLAAYRGEDPDTAGANRDKHVVKAVDNATSNMLQSTGDLTKAQGLLESVKDQVPLDDYNKIQTKLEKGNNFIQQQAIKDKTNKQISNSLDLYSGLASGKVGWQSMNNIDDMEITEPTKIAFQSALDAKNIKTSPKGADASSIGYVPKKDKAFAEHIADVLNQPDQQGVVNQLNEALHGYGRGTVSEDRLTLIAKLALQRAKSLPPSVHQNYGKKVELEGEPDETMPHQSSTPQPTKQIESDSGLKSVMAWSKATGIESDDLYKNYVDASGRGVPAKEAAEGAIRAEVLKQYPKAAMMKGIPNVVVDPNSKARHIFQLTSDEETDEPTRIFDPNTGRFGANPKKKNAKGPK